MKSNKHYIAVAEFYGSDRASRSGVPLINHVDEGLVVLDMIKADIKAKEAYCLHPMIQGDSDLSRTLVNDLLNGLCPVAVALAMEYRATANAYLLDHYSLPWLDVINLSVVADVNDMLIADKVQNRKDFEFYHKDTHPRAVHLDQYFKNWMRVLSISEDRYQEFVKILEKTSDV